MVQIDVDIPVFFAFQPKARVQPQLPDLQVPLLLLRMPRSLKIHEAHEAPAMACGKEKHGAVAACKNLMELEGFMIFFLLEVIFNCKTFKHFPFLDPILSPHHPPTKKKRDKKSPACFMFFFQHPSTSVDPYLLLW